MTLPRTIMTMATRALCFAALVGSVVLLMHAPVAHSMSAARDEEHAKVWTAAMNYVQKTADAAGRRSLQQGGTVPPSPSLPPKASFTVDVTSGECIHLRGIVHAMAAC